MDIEFLDIDKRRCIFLIRKSTFKDLLRIEKKIKKSKQKVVLSNEIKEKFSKLDSKEKSKLKNIAQIIEFYKTDKSLYRSQIHSVINQVIFELEEIPQQQDVFLLVNEKNVKVEQIIKNISSEYKTINIVTNKISEFSSIENEEIIVLNNKRKSLRRAKFIVNVDFSEADINEFVVNRESIIFNISKNSLKQINGFDGTIINNVRINEAGKYLLQDIFIANMRDEKIVNKINREFENKNILLIGNNGPIYLTK